MGSIETTFSSLMSDLDQPMLIVTAYGAGEKAGCLVAFACQTSIHPQRFLACISRANHTFRIASAADTLIVHFVPEEAADLAELFGGVTGDRVDKFSEVEWHRGPGGAPQIARLETWFAGRVVDRVGLGDHVGFLLDPIEGAARRRSEEPLRFHRARRITPGHPA